MPAPSNSATRKPAKKAAAPAPAAVRTKKAAVSYAGMPWLAQYVEGIPPKYEFPKFALTRILDDATSSFPEHVALAFLGAKTTYRELKAQVDAFAGALAGLGVTKGDRVALVLPNCPQNVIAFFATLRLGAVVVEHNGTALLRSEVLAATVRDGDVLELVKAVAGG